MRSESHVREVAAALRLAAVDGAGDGAKHVLKVSNERVPREDGNLQKSGKVKVDRKAGVVSISYDYFTAVWQHENLNYQHDGGRQAKFLESAWTGEADRVVESIRGRVAHTIGGQS